MASEHGQAGSLLERGYVPHRPGTWPSRYAELARGCEAWRYDGTPCVLTAGTTVKIVMVSRFGDVGVTDDLEAEHGYIARVTTGDLLNLRESV